MQRPVREWQGRRLCFFFGGGGVNMSILQGGHTLHSTQGDMFSKHWSEEDVSPIVSLHCFLLLLGDVAPTVSLHCLLLLLGDVAPTVSLHCFLFPQFGMDAKLSSAPDYWHIDIKILWKIPPLTPFWSDDAIDLAGNLTFLTRRWETDSVTSFALVSFAFRVVVTLQKEKQTSSALSLPDILSTG